MDYDDIIKSFWFWLSVNSCKIIGCPNSMMIVYDNGNIKLLEHTIFYMKMLHINY